MSQIYDCIIIGGGPAGLTAAIYLARFRRKILIIDSQESRLKYIPISNNYSGFPQGIPGPILLNNFKKQALRYGTALIKSKVTELKQLKNGFFSVAAMNFRVHSKRVLLATGVTDIIPDIEGVEKLIKPGILRQCPICDGYEAINKSIAIVGQDVRCLREALFLQTFTEKITLLSNGDPLIVNRNTNIDISEFPLMTEKILAFKCIGKGVKICFPSGCKVYFDLIYTALGVKVNNELAKSIGAKIDAKGSILVNAKYETSVPFLYAAGDNTPAINQISVAVGQAAIAATDIHKSLA